MSEGRLERVKKEWIKDNRGSTIVMVIVVVAFITILATTLLYASAMNYQMKQTDFNNKQSFYEGETALEEIRSQLMCDVSLACENAYKRVMIQYAAVDGATRESAYYTAFLEELKAIWNGRLAAGTYEDVLRSWVDPVYQSGITLSAGVALTDRICYDKVHGYAVLQGVLLEYTDADGYTTRIATDFYMEAPDVSFALDTSKTAWDDTEVNPADSVSVEKALKREMIDSSACVSYLNWEKN